MGIKFDYDFGTNEVLIDDAPEGSTVIVNGTKYVPERTCKNTAYNKDDFCCSECGAYARGTMLDDFGCSVPVGRSFSKCPNCGMKVVK